MVMDRNHQMSLITAVRKYADDNKLLQDELKKKCEERELKAKKLVDLDVKYIDLDGKMITLTKEKEHVDDDLHNVLKQLSERVAETRVLKPQGLYSEVSSEARISALETQLANERDICQKQVTLACRTLVKNLPRSTIYLLPSLMAKKKKRQKKKTKGKLLAKKKNLTSLVSQMKNLLAKLHQLARLLLLPKTPLPKLPLQMLLFKHLQVQMFLWRRMVLIPSSLKLSAFFFVFFLLKKS